MFEERVHARAPSVVIMVTGASWSVFHGCCVNEKAPFRVASQMSPKSMYVPETDTSKRQWSDGASTVD